MLDRVLPALTGGDEIGRDRLVGADRDAQDDDVEVGASLQGHRGLVRPDGRCRVLEIGLDTREQRAVDELSPVRRARPAWEAVDVHERLVATQDLLRRGDLRLLGQLDACDAAGAELELFDPMEEFETDAALRLEQFVDRCEARVGGAGPEAVGERPFVGQRRPDEATQPGTCLHVLGRRPRLTGSPTGGTRRIGERSGVDRLEQRRALQDAAVRVLVLRDPGPKIDVIDDIETILEDPVAHRPADAGIRQVGLDPQVPLGVLGGGLDIRLDGVPEGPHEQRHEPRHHRVGDVPTARGRPQAGKGCGG